MENENLDLEIKPAGNKDVWLFLIIVDVVFLCVFGFFLYKNLSARLLAPAENVPAEVVVTQEEETQLPPAPQEEIIVAEEPVSVTESVPAAQPKEEKPVVAEVVSQAQAQQTEKQVQPTEKKESILIKTNPKSKYRQVTFRYFGEGDNVSVVSGFTMAKPRALKKKNGYWEITLGIAPGTYKFLYIVDGVQTLDPYAEEEDGRSVVVVE